MSDPDPFNDNQANIKHALRKVGQKALIILAIAAFPLFMLYIFGYSIKSSEEYACVLQIPERNRQVLAVTGDPVTPYFFAWISYFESGGGERQGNFSTGISGPNGSGTIQAQFYRTPVGQSLGIWFSSAGTEIEVYNGHYPCP